MAHSNETSSDVYSTEVITKILKEEGHALFDSRSASLGHTLQGGVPSPLDRARATRLAVKCCQFLEQHGQALREGTERFSAETAAIITIQGSTVGFTSAQEMAKQADMKNRRGYKAWWHNLKALAELMGGRTGLADV